MDFAKKILGKYGWKEGDGLGKSNNGIVKPLKASLKFDNAGLGVDKATEFNDHWWERCFNEAAKNVDVKKHNDGNIQMALKNSDDSVEISTKGYSMKKLKKAKEMANSKGATTYDNFLQTATLTQNGSEILNGDHIAVEDIAVTTVKVLTDEELFRACGGRTAHKGARHGLNLSGKLARLEEQERQMLAKLQGNVTTVPAVTEEVEQTKKHKKKKKDKKRELEAVEQIEEEPVTQVDTQESVKKKRRRLLEVVEQMEQNEPTATQEEAAIVEDVAAQEPLMKKPKKDNKLEQQEHKKKKKDKKKELEVVEQIEEEPIIQVDTQESIKKKRRRHLEVVEQMEENEPTVTQEEPAIVEDVEAQEPVKKKRKKDKKHEQQVEQHAILEESVEVIKPKKKKKKTLEN